MAVANYPAVIGEQETIATLLEGKSIARFGDGELKLMAGMDQMREPRNKPLGKELRTILLEPPAGCLAAVPTMDDKGPKYLNWRAHRIRFKQFLAPGVQYYSSFITRPDSAPWIRNEAFARDFEKLWKGKRVALVAEEGTAIHRLVQRSASYVELFVCPHTETYARIDDLQKSVLVYDPDVALLSCGPAATCLAARLSRNMQALDVGSCGGFLLKLLYGDGAESDGRSAK
jgi:hypothetical protein